ncbi:hypothetical protein E2C01_007395 [Portunus trituberculatus]|uniref:Uncharacterized protein n=1 Tax=Portunus trituberculatus TaxID=210409 RepID=A0A5B7CZD1_PORTR|nr:hypothetical protein [Portunus trituberculatus]
MQSFLVAKSRSCSSERPTWTWPCSTAMVAGTAPWTEREGGYVPCTVVGCEVSSHRQCLAGRLET